MPLADFGGSGWFSGPGPTLRTTVSLISAVPAAALAYFDPLSGFIPYSMPVAAGIGATAPQLFFSVQSGFSDLNPNWTAVGLGAAGAYLGPTLLTNFDYRTAGALGAFVGVMGGMMLIGSIEKKEGGRFI